MNPFITVLLWMTYIITLFYTIFYLLVFLDKKEGFVKRESEPDLKRYPMFSVIVPAYNEEDSIADTLASVTRLDYPKGRIETIVVNDGSADGTRKAVERFIRDHPADKVALLNQRNRGKAASLNNGMEKARGEYFACLDADSEVDPKALKRMLKMFEDRPDIMVVTPAMRVNRPRSLLERMQALEYISSLWLYRVTAEIDCVYVAPGPFSIYRRAVVMDLGGFDEHNLAEDQEIAYRMQSKQYLIRHCPDAFVYTNSPTSFNSLYHQRIRWYKGGFFNFLKYKRLMLNRRYGDFGMFQMPRTIFGFFLGLAACFFFVYFAVWPIFEKMHDLFVVGFDIRPYLRDLFRISFDFLSYDVGKGFVAVVIFLAGVLILYLSHKNIGERVRNNRLITLIPYFLVFYMVMGFICLIAMVEHVFRRKQRW
jgi:cellulose synthase/poly-beta-1,6-N-acetylglucosamine synthase-like glycosyltransferase